MNTPEQVQHSTPVDRFAARLSASGLPVLSRQRISRLQVNVGKLCNQACLHCHVEAGPKRTEQMQRGSFSKLLQLLDRGSDVHTVDITGGAPELNPHFRWFVAELRSRGLQVIDRCNLTVLFEPGQEDTARFLADHKVQIVASLPCYSSANVDKQRGKGTFAKSIDALQLLNSLGYGSGELDLSLVYNPVGAHLPPEQAGLEADYKARLMQDFSVVFNRLYTITNMPIKRFADQLRRQGKSAAYMQLLIDNFNTGAVNSVMCRELVSVGWDGQLYDCDFNQMLEMSLDHRLEELSSLDEIHDPILTADHCFGCTAGAGSSCGGALT